MISRHPPFTTTDLDEARAYLSQLLRRRMDILAKGAAFMFTAETTALEYITVTRMSSSVPLLVQTEAVSGYSLVRMEEGSVERVYENFQINAGPGQGVLTSPGKDLVTKSTAFAVTSISIPAIALESEAVQLIGDQLPGPLEIKMALPMRNTLMGQRIDYLLIELERWRDNEGFIWNEQFNALRLGYQRNMIIELINNTPNNYEELLARRHGGNANRMVAQLKEYLYANLRDDITLGDMATALSTSASTLNANCLKVPPNLTPAALLHDMRLEALHRRLEYPLPGENVDSIGYEYHLPHGGRRAEDYRRKYGELPNVTLERGRRKNGLRDP